MSVDNAVIHERLIEKSPKGKRRLTINVSSFVEHRSGCERFCNDAYQLGTTFVLPGATTSCNGSSSTSCCNWD